MVDWGGGGILSLVLSDFKVLSVFKPNAKLTVVTNDLED